MIAVLPRRAELGWRVFGWKSATNVLPPPSRLWGPRSISSLVFADPRSRPPLLCGLGVPRSAPKDLVMRLSPSRLAPLARLSSALLVALFAAPLSMSTAACGGAEEDDADLTITDGRAGDGGSAGASGAGAGGAAGGQGGAGNANAGGGSGGTDADGGEGGSAGDAGDAGAAGHAGDAGAASETAGEGGAAGDAGEGGTSGAAGAAGAAGTAGTGGQAGAPPEPIPDVVIAAAGDISNTSISGQKITAGLIQGAGFDAVLTLGDNQYNDGALSAYNNYFDKTWGKFINKIHPVPGNHEYNTTGAKGYYSYFGEAAGDPKKGYYSFDLGAWHIVAINSNSECGAVPCNAGSAQEKWLRKDLAAHTQKCTLAYFHHPLFSSGEHGNATVMKPIWNALYDNNVDIVLNGHDHDYERFGPQDPSGAADAKRGIVEFVVGTGGTGFRTFPNVKKHSQARQAKWFGVLKLTLKKAGWDFEFVGEPGSTFKDKGSDQCH